MPHAAAARGFVWLRGQAIFAYSGHGKECKQGSRHHRLTADKVKALL